MRRLPFTREAIETPGHLSERITYDPSSGALYWRERPRDHFSTDRAWKTFNSRNAGRPTGEAIGVSGYLWVRIDGHLTTAHRVAWVLGTGQPIPAGMMVDHVDGTKTNNILTNLRLADKAQNAQNSAGRKSNPFPKGVTFDKRRQKFSVRIGANSRYYFGGRFDTLEEAALVADRLIRSLHGAFANSGNSDAL